jgi:hypothetical protein
MRGPSTGLIVGFSLGCDIGVGGWGSGIAREALDAGVPGMGDTELLVGVVAGPVMAARYLAGRGTGDSRTNGALSRFTG